LAVFVSVLLLSEVYPCRQSGVKDPCGGEGRGRGRLGGTLFPWGC